MQEDDWQDQPGRKRRKWVAWLLGAAMFLLVMAFFGEETQTPSRADTQTSIATPTPSPTPTLKIVSLTATPQPTVAVTSTVHETASADALAVPVAQQLLPVSDADITLCVTFDAVYVENQHVGKNWTQEYFLGDEAVPAQVAVHLHVGDEIVLRTVITENDKRPDVGEDETRLTVTENVRTTPIVVEKTVLVTENAGRYTGCSAEWNVIYTITILHEDEDTGGENHESGVLSGQP